MSNEITDELMCLKESEDITQEDFTELIQSIKNMEASFKQLQATLKQSAEWISQSIQQEMVWSREIETNYVS